MAKSTQTYLSATFQLFEKTDSPKTSDKEATLHDRICNTETNRGILCGQNAAEITNLQHSHHQQGSTEFGPRLGDFKSISDGAIVVHKAAQNVVSRFRFSRINMGGY